KAYVSGTNSSFERLKHDVHKLAVMTSGDDKIMWGAIERELLKIKVEDLGYDHPLCSGILDDCLTPFTEMSEELHKIFKVSSEKFLLPVYEPLKCVCVNFLEKERKKILTKSLERFGDASFGEFLDWPEEIEELANQM
ncbi:24279_t:CDS:2, partial [Entrophospora sp. SA101]